MKRWLWLLIIGCALAGVGVGIIILAQPAKPVQPAKPAKPASGTRYAVGFAFRDTEHGREAVVYSPWQAGKELAVYALDKPLTRLVTTSCTQVGMLDALSATDLIVGTCNRSLIYTPLSESVLDLGDALTPAIEPLVRCQCEGILVSQYSPSETTWQPAQRLGQPIYYDNDWLEKHPLGRAEWIRFIGALIGREREADSIFDAVVARYDSLAQLPHSANAPTLMTGQDFRGTWYVPGGVSFMGQLFRDAGAQYKYQDSPDEGSIPLTTEQAFKDFREAEIWVGCQAQSLDELQQVDDKHTWFRAYQEGQVYNYLRRSTPQGGNDFWERGAVHPDEVLQDLREVLYPTGKHELIYMQRLQ